MHDAGMFMAEGQDYLMEQSTPRQIEDNPSLPDGQYEALVRDIRLQRSSRETQIVLLFYLPEQQMHLVTDIREVAQDGVSSAPTANAARPRMGCDLGALHGKTKTHSTILSSVPRTCTLRV